MSDKEEFEKFILYGIEGETSLKDCIEGGIAFLLIFLLFTFIEYITERRNYVIMALGILSLLFYFISVFVLKRGRKIEGVHFILHNGIATGCCSFLFGLFGVEILLCSFDGKERILMICIAGAGYVFESILLYFVIKLQIKKRNYSRKKWRAGSAYASAAGAVLGISLAKTFFKNLDSGAAWGIVCILTFIVSYLAFIGTVSLYKYQYIVKHPKLLDIKPKSRGK